MEEIFEQLLATIDSKYDKTEGYLIYDLLKSVAIMQTKLADKLTEINKLLDIDHCTGGLLEKIVFQRKGIRKTKATHSLGILMVKGNGSIRQGDLFETASGIQFTATETVNITTSGHVKIICMSPGAVGNVPTNQITQMPITISGITSVTNAEPTHDGYEAETDNDLRERYYIAIQTPPTSGNVYHYLQWAKEVSGVGDARVLPVERGDNTVEIVLIDQNKKPSSALLVSQVQEYIDPGSKGLGEGEAPIGAKCYVISAEGLPVAISVIVQKSNDYSDSEIVQNIEAAIVNYLRDIAFKSNHVSYAKVGEAILNSKGVEDYSGLMINNGTSNLSVGNKQIAVLGAVSLV